MTQRYDDKGVVPVSVVSAGPCMVTQVKGDKDGYQAVQIGFETTKKKLSKSLQGHLKGLDFFRNVREFRSDAKPDRGQRVTVSSFKSGDVVQAMGISKGKGFQGVVKRHKFSGSPKSHGHKDQLRMPGSIGSTDPQHVFKGTRMAGRMGGQRVTIKNLVIVDVDEENNLLYIKGAVPGARNTLLAISGDGEMLFSDEKNDKPVQQDKVIEKTPELQSQDSKSVEKKDTEAQEVKVDKTSSKSEKA